jgi:endonuclease/exonuclease/phosphatase (EEP) superfamily protein YafD
VEAEVNRIDADIIVLVEVGNNKKPALDRLKSRYPHQAKCFNIDFCNLVILSKFPIAESSAQVKWEGAPYLMAKLGPELGGLSVIAVHTIRFPHSRAQFRQTTALSALIEKTPGRKLVMGDFNATPFSRIIQAIQTRTGLIRLSGLPSWPSHLELPQIAIDHIFVSPGIHAVETLRIGEAAGSDHYPIISTIAVPLTP